MRPNYHRIPCYEGSTLNGMNIIISHSETVDSVAGVTTITPPMMEVETRLPRNWCAVDYR
jgi:hypothetical protein